MAVIQVGGASEMEVKERKDRVDDALNATRAAVEEGMCRAAARRCCMRAALDVSSARTTTRARLGVIRKATETPLIQIAQNAGVDGGWCERCAAVRT